MPIIGDDGVAVGLDERTLIAATNLGIRTEKEPHAEKEASPPRWLVVAR